MKNTLPLLMIDFYKATHKEQYNPKMTKLVSYFTPRMSRIPGDDFLICFGVQAFCKEYLIDYFNENFFDLPEEDVVKEYNRVLEYTLGKGAYEDQKVRDLHRLGYLPIQIKAIPEGTKVPIKVPMIEISNTHPNFAWVTNTIESLMSTTLWHTMLSANVGYKYREIVNYWYDCTVDDNIPKNRALGDFSYRGQHSNESAIKSSAAFCLSFLNTATVPAIPWLEKNYNCDCTKDQVAYGAISTEHSVMCSNYAVDGNEKDFVRRLLTEIYPNHSFSMVSDSYDYWNMVTEILPSLKKEIMEHKGTLSVRGDSGDPVDIICGDIEVENLNEFEDLEDAILDMEIELEAMDKSEGYFEYKGKIYRVYYKNGLLNKYACEEYTLTKENKGTVELLWEQFGGTINKKGYKVLDPHIKAIYGDSITPQRCEEIYRRLEQKGFASNNVTLGVGSFSFMCLVDWELTDDFIEDIHGDYIFLEQEVTYPYTRDTYGIAVKSTYGEIDGKPIMIFKDPKTDTGKFKKSQKGLCRVYRNEDGEITYEDGLIKSNEDNNMLTTVFKNSSMVKEYSLKEIRNTLHEGEF